MLEGYLKNNLKVAAVYLAQVSAMMARVGNRVLGDG